METTIGPMGSEQGRVESRRSIESRFPVIQLRPSILSFYASWMTMVALFWSGFGLHIFFQGLLQSEQAIEHPLYGIAAAVQFPLPLIGGIIGQGNLGTVLWAILMFVVAVQGLAILIQWYSVIWMLYPDRLHMVKGIVAVKRVSLYYQNARLPTLKQGIIDRMLGIGSVEVSSVGTGMAGDFRLWGINHPVWVKDTIMQRMEYCRIHSISRNESSE